MPLKKKRILIPLIAILFFGGAIFYINKTILPVQVKKLAILKAQEILKRDITFDTLQWNPFKGFALTNITVFQKDNPKETLLHIDELTAQVLFIPFISRTITIPFITIKNPNILFTRTGDTWNFSDLIPPSTKDQADTPQPKLPNIIIANITLTNGKIHLQDIDPMSQDIIFEETLTPVKLEGSIGINKKASFNVHIGLKETQGQIAIYGEGNLTHKDMFIHVDTRKLKLTRYLRFIPNALPIQIHAGEIANASLDVNLSDQTQSVKGHLSLVDIDMQTQENVVLQGSLDMQNISVKQTQHSLSLSGAIDYKKLLIRLKEDLTILGEGQITIETLLKQEDTLKIVGSLSSPILKIENGKILQLQTAIKATVINVLEKDNRLTGEISCEISDLLAYLEGQTSIKGDLSIPTLTLTKNGEQLSLEASEIIVPQFLISLAKKQHIHLTNTRFEAAQVNLHDEDLDLQMDIESEKVQIEQDGLSLTTGLSAPETALHLKKGNINLLLKPYLKEASIALPQNIKITGSPSGDITISTLNKTPSYKGMLNLAGINISGVPQIGNIANLQGAVSFETNKASTDSIILSVWDTPLTISGEVTNFENPNLDIQVQAPDMDVALLKKSLPKIFEEYEASVQGKTDIFLTLKGQLQDITHAQCEGTAKLKNISASTQKFNQAINDINGDLKFSTTTLHWKDLSLLWQDHDILLNGHLEDFKNPILTTNIKTHDLFLDIQARKAEHIIHIPELQATWRDASVKAKGAITLTGSQPPAIDITAHGKLPLKDLSDMVPPYAQSIRDLDLSGILKISAEIKGYLTDWKDLKTDIRVTTPAIKVKGYSINDVDIKMHQEDGFIDPLDITALFYTGEVDITGKIDLTDPAVGFDTKFTSNQINLELLKRDTPLKNKRISGFLSLNGHTYGTAQNWENMVGKLDMNLKDGYIWELETLSDVLSILSSSFKGGNMIITDASGLWDIRDGKMHTENLAMNSPSLSMTAEGWIGLNQSVDLNLFPRIDPNALNQRNFLNQISPDQDLLDIHIGGTLTKPKITHNLTPQKILQKTLERTVGDLFLKVFD